MRPLSSDNAFSESRLYISENVLPLILKYSSDRLLNDDVHLLHAELKIGNFPRLSLPLVRLFCVANGWCNFMNIPKVLYNTLWSARGHATIMFCHWLAH